jgi:2-polyprenyl-3-methyl-5-hydroxy-6-metoxy-1,4-benzoquinol methylase
MRNLLKYAEDYSQQPFDQTHLRFRRIKLIEQIKKYPHQTILEISCGKRPFFQDFNDFDKLIIVEPTMAFFDNANSLLKDNPKLGSKVLMINEYFENAIEELNTFHLDFIILSNVLQEIEDVSTFVKGLYKICKKDTIVHIVVPNAKSFHRLLAFEMGIIDSVYQLSDRNNLLQQKSVFDLQSLSELLLNNGFEIIQTGSSFIKPFTHQQMHDMLKQEIINEKVLDGLYNMEKYLPNLGSELFIDCKIQ